MRVTSDMKVKSVLAIGEQMTDAFVWLAPQFERLRNATLRKAMANRVTVEQAARIAAVPLAEALYVLNLAAGEDPDALTRELEAMRPEAFTRAPADPPRKPLELLGLSDDDPRICFLDLMGHAVRNEDPLPAIMRRVLALRGASEVLLIRHPFDPISLRDLLARRGLASWAEERRQDDWYIYFHRTAAPLAAVAHPPVPVKAYAAAV